MLANVKIDSPAGCTMVAGTLDGASDPSAPLDDSAMVNISRISFIFHCYFEIVFFFYQKPFIRNLIE